MSDVIGTIEKVLSRDWQDTKLWSFKVREDERIFGTGRSPVRFEAGTIVSFSPFQKGRYWNVKAESVRQSDAQPAKAAPQSSGGSSYDTRQKVIELQSCRNSALALVGILAEQKAIPFGTKASTKDKAEIIDGLVEAYVAQYLEENRHVANGIDFRGNSSTSASNDNDGSGGEVSDDWAD